jgi:hypothetical protein
MTTESGCGDIEIQGSNSQQNAPRWRGFRVFGTSAKPEGFLASVAGLRSRRNRHSHIHVLERSESSSQKKKTPH